MLGIYFVFLTPEPDSYTTIYLLDTNKKAMDYPQYLVAGVNSTYSIYVHVENHNGTTLDFQVRIKITKEMNPSFPVEINATQTLNATLRDGESWETVTTTSLDEPGNYSVIYELWTEDREGKELFTDNQCVLNIRVAPRENTT